jgi:vacuolar-type H+-ATPase subunit E/Vma4
MELQTQEILSLLPTKENIDTLSSLIAYQVKEGEVDPAEAIVKVTAMEQVCKAVRSKIEEDVLDKLGLYNGKYTYNGAKIERAEVGTSYDYSHDSRWNELKSIADAANKQLKEHEEALKKIPSGKLLVCDDNGETFVGPAKSSKTSFKITLSK